ncbi:MAG TPA: nucleotide exchange factor GrpE, partial [Fimbriimonadaceae bacterium]|nr:nucleotide exchange factor GrpE [Fimbriimonadaceae bacterium]
MNVEDASPEETMGKKKPEEPTPEQQKIAELEARCAALQDQMVRSMAEAQNIQRRMREQFAEDVRFAARPLVEALLPVLDNFERSIASLEQGASAESVLEGVRAIERQLRQALAKAQVERIEATGKKFDPDVHEAVSAIESQEHEPDTVAAEIEPGYKMHGRV